MPHPHDRAFELWFVWTGDFITLFVSICWWLYDTQKIHHQGSLKSSLNVDA